MERPRIVTSADLRVTVMLSVKDRLLTRQLDLLPTGLRRADHIERLGFQKIYQKNVVS